MLLYAFIIASRAREAHNKWKFRSEPAILTLGKPYGWVPACGGSDAGARQLRHKPQTGNCGASEMHMKTQGEIEAAICNGVGRFELEYMGRGPKDVHAHLIGDLLVVRLHGVLTAAEQQLVKTLPSEKGRGLLKQVRTQLMETARPALEAMVQAITGAKVISLHHDISTTTGEEVVLFTLETPLVLRETKRG
jgi:uncharacterized protein YbcI